MTKKILFIILTLTILVAVGGVGGYLFTAQKNSKQNKQTELVLSEKTQVERKASFYLKTDKQTFTEGEFFNLVIIVKAEAQVIDGAEFLLNYDPSLVKLGEPIPGTFFSVYPQKKVDNEKGTVKVIALQPPGESKSLKEEIMVTLPITVLQKGKAVFEFDKSKTHIAGYGGQELLEESVSLSISII